jgi:DNA-binding helix-hairpin-helix protein with protein kinase domain
MMAIDDLLDRGRDARRRRDEAATELVAVLQALEGLAGVDLLDATQKRELARLRERPRSKRTSRRRTAPAKGA